jgi:hypothetical protein
MPELYTRIAASLGVISFSDKCQLILRPNYEMLASSLKILKETVKGKGTAYKIYTV